MWLFFKTRGEAEHGQVIDDVDDKSDEEEGGQGGRREGTADHEKGQNAADGAIQRENDGVGMVGASGGRAAEEGEGNHREEQSDEDEGENPHVQGDDCFVG